MTSNHIFLPNNSDDQYNRLSKFDHLLNETTYYIGDDYIQGIDATGTHTTICYHDGGTLVARKDPGDA